MADALREIAETPRARLEDDLLMKALQVDWSELTEPVDAVLEGSVPNLELEFDPVE